MRKIAVAAFTLAVYAALGAAAIVKLVENPKWDLRCKIGQAAPELCPTPTHPTHPTHPHSHPTPQSGEAK